MFHRTLVPRNEYVLGEGTTLALWCGMLIRVLWNFLVLKRVTLMDAQLFWGLVLIGLLYAWGSLAPRRLSMAVFVPAGMVGWLAAVTTAAAIPWLPAIRDLWWSVPVLGQPYPLWLKIAGGVILAVGIYLRFRAQRTAVNIVLSRGHGRTMEWAQHMPFYCRVVVKRLLAARGVEC